MKFKNILIYLFVVNQVGLSNGMDKIPEYRRALYDRVWTEASKYPGITKTEYDVSIVRWDKIRAKHNYAQGNYCVQTGNLEDGTAVFHLIQPEDEYMLFVLRHSSKIGAASDGFHEGSSGSHDASGGGGNGSSGGGGRDVESESCGENYWIQIRQSPGNQTFERSLIDPFPVAKIIAAKQRAAFDKLSEIEQKGVIVANIASASAFRNAHLLTQACLGGGQSVEYYTELLVTDLKNLLRLRLELKPGITVPELEALAEEFIGRLHSVAAVPAAILHKIGEQEIAGYIVSLKQNQFPKLCTNGETYLFYIQRDLAINLSKQVEKDLKNIKDFISKDMGFSDLLNKRGMSKELILSSDFECVGTSKDGKKRFYRTKAVLHGTKKVVKVLNPRTWVGGSSEKRDYVVDATVDSSKNGDPKLVIKFPDQVNDLDLIRLSTDTKIRYYTSSPGAEELLGNVAGSGDGAQDKTEDMQRLISAGIPEDIAHWAAYEPEEFERICQRPRQQQAQLEQESKAREKQSLISAGIPEDIADFVVNDPEGFERLRQESLGRRSGETHDLRPDISSAAPQPSVEKSVPQQPTLGERVREFFSRTTTAVAERSKVAARDFSFGAARAVATAGTDHLLRYLFASPPPMDGAHFFGKGPEETRYTPYLDRPLLNLRTTLPHDVEMRDVPQDPESAACSAGTSAFPIIFDDTARPLKIKRTGDFSSSPTVIDEPFVIPHSVVGMEEPAATTQSGGLTPGQFKKFTEKTSSYNEALARIASSDTTLKSTCEFVGVLNKFADLYAQTDGDDGSAYALRFAARYMVKYGQNTAKIFGNHAQRAAAGLQRFGLENLQFFTDIATHPAETLAKLKEGTKALTILSTKMALIGGMIEENPELGIETFNRELKPIIKPMVDKLEAMTGPERTELIFYGLCHVFSCRYLTPALEVSFATTLPRVHNLQLAATAIKECGELVIREQEIAHSIPNFANLPAAVKNIFTPTSTISENLGKFRKIAQQKGQDFARKVAEALQRNPELVITEGSFDGAVARIVGDFEREGAAAAEDLGSFRRGDGGRQIPTEPVQASGRSARIIEFEQRISRMPPGERVAAIKTEAERVAQASGLKFDRDLSRINKRDVYKDENARMFYSVDSQHGRFEALNRNGKHLGEVDFDFKQTKKADLSGRHDLKMK